VPQGSQQFTPRQLLDAGRHAEAEGRLDLAHQFYRHLADQYGYTSEAAEGRSHLARIEAAGRQIWQTNGNAPLARGTNGRLASAPSQRPRHATRRDPYRVGRALAALMSGLGWLLIAGALAWLAAGAAWEVAQIPALATFRLATDVALQLGGALLGGAVMLLAGQAARALFDQAAAVRELASTRWKANGDHG
jgi:hypothetical protein